MISEKRKKTIWLRLCFMGVLCISVLIFGIGAAQARYRMSKPTDVEFQALQNQQVFLWSGADADESTLTALDDWTETDSGSAKLNFKISNGTAEDDYCSKPLSFTIRILASQGIQKSENVTISLQIEGEQYTAVPEQILEGSSRYDTFGPGWIYCFYDSNGIEVSWDLDEGKLSVVTAELTVEGAVQYTSLLRLEATAL